MEFSFHVNFFIISVNVFYFALFIRGVRISACVFASSSVQENALLALFSFPFLFSVNFLHQRERFVDANKCDLVWTLTLCRLCQSSRNQLMEICVWLVQKWATENEQSKKTQSDDRWCVCSFNLQCMRALDRDNTKFIHSTCFHFTCTKNRNCFLLAKMKKLRPEKWTERKKHKCETGECACALRTNWHTHTQHAHNIEQKNHMRNRKRVHKRPMNFPLNVKKNFTFLWSTNGNKKKKKTNLASSLMRASGCCALLCGPPKRNVNIAMNENKGKSRMENIEKLVDCVLSSCFWFTFWSHGFDEITKHKNNDEKQYWNHFVLSIEYDVSSSSNFWERNNISFCSCESWFSVACRCRGRLFSKMFVHNKMRRCARKREGVRGTMKATKHLSLKVYVLTLGSCVEYDRLNSYIRAKCQIDKKCRKTTKPKP